MLSVLWRRELLLSTRSNQAVPEEKKRERARNQRSSLLLCLSASCSKTVQLTAIVIFLLRFQRDARGAGPQGAGGSAEHHCGRGSCGNP